LGVRAHVEVAAGAPYPAEIAGLVYFCCLEVLERAGEGARATIAVRDEEEALVFDVGAGVVDSAAGLDAGLQRVRDRIEALGGQLSLRSDPTDGTRVSGSLPLSR
jgi:glucose-6-phosphate-specific signal transduction histidine kinase